MGFKTGDKVTYTPFVGCAPSLLEKGIVKNLSHREGFVFVVFHCAGEWDNYRDYTAQACDSSRLEAGWEETCDHYFLDDSRWTSTRSCQFCGLSVEK
jgi:hypothetical protein